MRLIVVGDDVVLKQRTASLSGTEVSSVDSKGINRGPCEAEGCGDCDKYIHDPVKGAQCQYCGCFPTKHRHLKGKAVNVLDTKTENVHSSSEIHIYDNGANMSVYDVDDFENMYLQTDRESPLQDECGPNPKRVKLQNLSGTPSGSSAPQQECTCFKSLEVLSKQTQTVSNNFSLSNGAISKMSREEKYEFCVPTRLPLNKLSPSHANNMSIVKWISWSMWNMNITSSEDFFNVARLALKRYPVLLSTSSEGRGPSHLVRLLKKSLGLPTANNNEETSGKPKKEDPPKLLKPEALEHKNLSHYNQIKVHIQKEMQKPEPSLGLLRSLLSSCRKQRKVLSQINSYSMLMDELPCLQIPELLLWDFIQQEHLNCSVEDLKTRWLNALPKMASYFSLENPSELSTFDDGQTSVNVLRCLTSSNWFGPNQSAKVERKDLVLEVFESNILPIFVFPQNGDPPRLFMMGNSDDLPTCVYVEGKPVYKGHIVDALVFLVAVYHVFNFTPSPGAEAAFSFIFGILMRQRAKKRFQKHVSVVSALKAVGDGYFGL